MRVPEAALEAALDARRVVVVTGAGMSAESGVPTFRDAQTGLWERYAAEDLATPEAWDRDPAFVWAWYLSRFGAVAHVEPNAGHRAVARWAALADVRVVTQNVDDLHERAGSRDVVHLHGSLASFRCARCETAYAGTVDVPDTEVDRVDPPTCPRCGGRVRPGVVWFGELLPLDAWEQAVALVEAADLVLVVGTSGIVHPAAGLPAVARRAGAAVVEVNPLETDVSDVAHVVWRESAAMALPALVDSLAPALERRRGQA
ncbi:NAD-dependent deacylase [Terrabacter terrigena]|uniref:NAD-dependent protein deacylase n=1 Tax=Terrabacter terrigena TaxID=574718 RepID=A0ABW3MVV9_9MICO